MTPIRVLFLCTGNSARSIIGQAMLREMGGEAFEVYSAGTEPRAEVHPLAVRVMNEVGIDIAAHRPKGLKEFLGRLPVRYQIIVCSGADQSCPRVFPRLSERLYWPFDDPALFDGPPDATLTEFRRIRDEIKDRVVEWLK